MLTFSQTPALLLLFVYFIYTLKLRVRLSASKAKGMMKFCMMIILYMKDKGWCDNVIPSFFAIRQLSRCSSPSSVITKLPSRRRRFLIR